MKRTIATLITVLIALPTLATVTATNRSVEYTGDGATTSLAVTFPFIESDDLQVISTVISTGAETTLTENTHYTVSGGDYATGTVTVITPATNFPSTVTWTIKRVTDNTQETDYVENSAFSAESHEKALDKLTYQAQEVSNDYARVLKQPVSDDNTIGELPTATDRASTYLGFDASGDPTALSAPTDTALTTSFSETLLDDTTAAAARTTLGAQQDVVTTRGDLIYANSTPAAARLAIGASGTVLTSDGTDPAWTLPADPADNLLINGEFQVGQRGTSFTAATSVTNSDDTYLLDRWILISDGNDRVDVTQETTTIPAGGSYAVKLDVETVSATSEKFGLVQIVENRVARKAIGGTVSLSFKARTTSSAVENLGAAVLAWDSTSDAVTSDVVSAWGAEGAEPTWATNWTREGSDPSSDLKALTNSYQTFKVEGVSVDTASAANIAVVIWADDTDLTAGDLVYITDVQLEVSDVATSFIRRPLEHEILRCQRYYVKTFPQVTVPAQNAGVTGALYTMAQNSSGDYEFRWRLPTEMFASPSVTRYNPGAANAQAYNVTASADAAAGAPSSTNSDQVQIAIWEEAGAAGDAGDELAIHVTAEAEL